MPRKGKKINVEGRGGEVWNSSGDFMEPHERHCEQMERSWSGDSGLPGWIPLSGLQPRSTGVPTFWSHSPGSTESQSEGEGEEDNLLARAELVVYLTPSLPYVRLYSWFPRGERTLGEVRCQGDGDKNDPRKSLGRRSGQDWRPCVFDFCRCRRWCEGPSFSPTSYAESPALANYLFWNGAHLAWPPSLLSHIYNTLLCHSLTQSNQSYLAALEASFRQERDPEAIERNRQ